MWGMGIAVGKEQRILVMISHLFCNDICSIHNFVTVWNNIGIVGRVCLVDVNKTHDDTDVDKQKH